MRREWSGNDQELQTKLWGGREPKVVSDEAFDMLEQGRLDSRLMDEERKQRDSTLGFASIALPWPLVSDKFIGPFITRRRFAASYLLMDRAVAQVARLLSGKIQPLSLEEAQRRSPKGTSSGLPWWSTDETVLPDYLKRARQIKQSQNAEEFYPFVSGRRTTNAGYGEVSKQRLLWIVDKAEVPLGKSVADPVLEHLNQLSHFAAWREPSIIDAAVTRLLYNGFNTYSIDFSAFDASVNSYLIAQAFKLLIDWTGAQYLEVVMDHFVSGALLTPDGLIEGRDGGVPSGSSLTNMIDTLVQAVVWHYVALVLGVTLVDWMVLGDDAVVQFQPDPGIVELESVMDDLGLKINPDKMMIGKGVCHYLQNVHMLDHLIEGKAVAVRSAMRMIHRAMMPERFPAGMSGALVSVGAALKIDKCSGHPMFPQIVDFLYDGDELLHDHSLVQLLRQAGGANTVKSALKLNSFVHTERDPSIIGALPITAQIEVSRNKRNQRVST
jgi:hypothetical protein